MKVKATRGVFSYSLGRKYIMSITGLFLCSFLVIHLWGNFQLYFPDEGVKFNAYTVFMTSNPLIKFMEIVLVAGFLVHIIDAIIITRKNTLARPVGYALARPSENSTWYSRNMGLTGLIIFLFLIIHLRGFWYEYHFGEGPRTFVGEAEVNNMYEIVRASYAQWWYSAIYVVSMLLLGAHLNHGVQAAFKSLGLTNKKYSGTIKALGTIFAIVIALGFVSFPILFYFGIVG
jgi:succinate dehydrogenase / fumarate reductase, cytochrome b subunit